MSSRFLGEPATPLLGGRNSRAGVAGVVPGATSPHRLMHGAIFRANLAIRQASGFLNRVVVSDLSPRVSSLPDGKHGPARLARAGVNRPVDIGTTNLPKAKESPELPSRITCDASAPLTRN